MPRSAAALCCVACAACLAAAVLAQEPTAPPLAWLRFDQATQTYAGRKYLWLGDGELQLSVDLKPGPGHVLQLLWGAKNDERSATLTVNGRDLELHQGGFNGWQWVNVSLPDGLPGDHYELLFRPGTTRHPAFFAEVRVTGPGATAVEMKEPARRITLERGPVPGEAFPDMRGLWDREPPPDTSGDPTEARFRQAEHNGRLNAEALYRCRRFVDGWLAHADPKSGLIPRNLTQSRDLWNAKDAAADNYPFMVLTCALTDRALFDGRMRDMLAAETRLTSRLGRLPDDFLFSKQGFASDQPNLDSIIFGGAEYVKDGLIPLTEWLGPSPWSERMTGIMEDIWQHAEVDTPFGKIPTLNFEVNGDLLQGCSRLYWFTGDRRYLDWAIRLGNYYLLGDHHPTRNLDRLRLIDHGCEVINGLSELYVAVAQVLPDQREAYRAPLRAIYDRILEVGRDEHGLLFSQFNPQTGDHSAGVCDTWGYTYDGFYTLWLLDAVEGYRDAVRHVLADLRANSTGRDWGGADGYADSLEGAINLLQREPDPTAAAWVDSEIRTMWAVQKPDGVIEGWHGDGNYARTTIMYALWKSQGVTLQPWRPDLRLGAVRDGDALLLSLASEQPWSGKLVFDRPRHLEFLHLPLDYPRINQFPEWFPVAAAGAYQVRDAATDESRVVPARVLRDGLPTELEGGGERRLSVAPGEV